MVLSWSVLLTVFYHFYQESLPKSDMELHFKSAGVNFGGRHGRISHYTYEETLSMKFTVYWAEDYEIELRPL